jgi:hypothetical protein
MEMLVSFLASVVVGQLDSVPCDIVGYQYRFNTGNKEECCNYAWTDCYAGANYCSVSHHYHCCGLNENNAWVSCLDKTKAECDALTGYKWCSTDPPAPPADDGISEAIVTVIVFVSLVAVAGAAGVYAAMGT